MGDTGALPLGGLLGLLAVVARQELLLVVVGGVFVAEAASVILQVGLLQVAAAADLPLRPAAPPLPVPGLAGEQDRRPLLDRRRPVRLVGLAGLKLNVREFRGQSLEVRGQGSKASSQMLNAQCSMTNDYQPPLPP